jgi:phospholipid/cholesterol/gamma-HCH transport system ATP-binding protein
MNADELLPTAALEFDRVTMAFDDEVVLRDVSFRLERGQMLILTGISGSGKSVLLRLAAGFYPPTSGAILVDGQHIEALDEEELLPLRSRLLGFVFQENALFSSLSTFDNTAFRLAEHDWPEEETKHAVLEILRFVGLETDVDKLPEELSIGMGRRLEIARALVGWPPIMLFDEPTSGLDPMNEKQVMNLILTARDVHHISSIYVTKEIREIPYLARHFVRQDADAAITVCEGPPPSGWPTLVLVLRDGGVAFQGDVDAFLTTDCPAVVELRDYVSPNVRRVHTAHETAGRA